MNLVFSSENKQEDEEKVFTLYDAITLAIQHNYDVRKQQQALIIAEAKYRQAKGALDISVGTQGDYTYNHNPVDPRDPNSLYGYSFITPESVYGIFSNNSLTRQTGGSIFAQKLFSFGLQSKLSYSVRRNNNVTDYEFGEAFASNTYRRTRDETESWAAFLFCYLAATNKSPPYFFIYCHLPVKFSYCGCKDTQKKCNFAV